MTVEDPEATSVAVRVRLDIAYDGTDFTGWARQPGMRTVQGVLEESLGKVLREPIQLTVAGRTDAGVHAEGQVAHFDTAAGPDYDKLLHRLARFLPKDVRVTGIRTAPPEFDARFSAIRRHYAYRLTTAPYGAPPLLARSVVACRPGVDIDAMREASRKLLGLHDFAAFCRRREGATTVRELQRFEWVTSPIEYLREGGCRWLGGRCGPYAHRLRERRRLLLVHGPQPGRRGPGRGGGASHPRMDGIPSRAT